MLLDDIKQALCAAIDSRAATLGGLSGLRADVRLSDSGAVREVSLMPTFDFRVRGRIAPLDNYEFGDTSDVKTIRTQ